MSLREILMLFFMALIWAAHFSIVKVSIGNVIEPMHYAAWRMSFVALLLIPLLKIHKGQMKKILIAGVCFGGLNYAFMFTGIKFTNASLSAMTMELYAPIAMGLSVLFLKEKIGLPRVISFAVAFVGIMIIYSAKEVDGMGSRPIFGLFLLIGAALVEAIGAILIKQIKGVKPFQLLAWFAVVGSVVLWIATFAFEKDHGQLFQDNRWQQFIPVLAYSVILASLFGQATYYWLLSRLPVNLVSCSTLLTALLAVFFGVVFLSEPVTWQLFVGSVLTLSGVGTILIRSGRKASASMPDAPMIKDEK